MTRLSAQDTSFLTLETRDTPMHIGFLPVSYTHLDVYKRQALRRQ